MALFKLMCTRDYLAKQKGVLNETDVLESISRKKMNTKGKFYKLMNLTVFAALLKDVPVGSKMPFCANLFRKVIESAVSISKRKQNNHIRTTCAFFALALYLHGNQKLEEKTTKKFLFFMNRMDGASSSQFQGVHMNDMPSVEDQQ